jgi:histone H3/H4
MSEFQTFPKPSFNRKVKKKGDRSKFSKMVRDELKSYFDNACQECGGKGIHIHHVKFRSQGGR